MLYKATISFSGVKSAVAGDVLELEDKALVDDLLKAGYIIPYEADKLKASKPKAEKPKEEKPKAKTTSKGKGKKNEG